MYHFYGNFETIRYNYFYCANILLFTVWFFLHFMVHFEFYKNNKTLTQQYATHPNQQLSQIQQAFLIIF